MRRSPGRWGLAVLGLALFVVPAEASAARIVAGPVPVSYQNPNIEIDAGEAVTFFNLDLTAPHDVTSVDIGPGAEALFRSATVGALTEVPVAGAESLDPGTYDFICSIHSFMAGTITVRGGGGGEDRTAPSLSVKALDSKLAAVERAGELRLRAKVNERATVKVVARAGRHGPKLASGRAHLDRGAGTVAAALTSKGERVVAKGERLRLAIAASATDAAGNSRKRTLGLTLR